MTRPVFVPPFPDFLASYRSLWAYGPFVGALTVSDTPCIGLAEPDGRVIPARMQGRTQ